MTTLAPMRSRLLLIGVSVGLLAACGVRDPDHAESVASVTDEGDDSAPQHDPEPPTPAAPTHPAPAAGAPSAASVPGSDEPGAVYFVINSVGLIELDETGVKVILAAPERNILDLFIGPAGAVHVLDAHSLRKLDPNTDALVEIERFEPGEVGPVNALALARDGGVWVTNGEGVGARVDGEWVFTGFDTLGVERSAGLAIAADQTPWLVGARQALYREAQGWVPVDPSLLRELPVLLHATASPSGPVNVTTGRELTRLGKTSLDSVRLDPEQPLSYTADLDIAADGHAALATSACDLVRVNPEPPTQIWRFAARDYDCQGLEAIALDARHRVWVASHEGLSVVAEDRVVHEYPAGSFAALAGRVSHMVVTGGGPELPPVGVVQTSTLGATLVVAGADTDSVAANAKVELCPSARLHSEGSPCADAKRRYVGTTDAKGRLQLAGVAIGDYAVALELDGRWRWTAPPSFAAQLRPGQIHELGTITLPER